MDYLTQQIKEKDKPAIVCPTCDSQWFHEIVAAKYMYDHTVVTGQRVPTVPGQAEYILLQCVRCGDIVEPKMSLHELDYTRKGYLDLRKTLMGEGDKRKVKEEVKEEKKDEVQDKE
jgi:DNA-directed RNA polymerase subunit RPC12/RpoP